MENSHLKYGLLAFRMRPYTPIPWILICLGFARFSFSLFFAGIVFIAGGELLRFYSAGFLGPKLRSIDRAVADDLVQAGPYRVVRNPIYVGNMSIYFGFGVLSNVFFPVFPLLILLFFMIIYGLIARYESSVLASTFPVEFRQYERTVPAFFPRLSSHRPQSDRRFDRIKAWETERPTLFVLVLSMGLLLTKMLYF